ncbi:MULTISPECIES: hypothetical protein [unclassified Pseudoalteromonas]|uniref:hypothetical protein n=1 Tax=unclassified Pseudoalteromonas TaxID=194690 RepID=UPI00140CF596|nr:MULTISPECIES: hypothetical protein [unclassified Pseudoalteromonas]MBH0029180.1 hypothetical protein [Pseudoalteromonas sp. SWN29]
MFTNKKSLLALSVASAVALSGCGSDKDNNEPVAPVVPPVVVVVPPQAAAEITSVVVGSVVDSATSNVVAAKVSFLEAGVAATNLVDLDGNAVTSMDLEDGSFSFVVKDGASVSQVTAIVSADGYVTKSYVINLAKLSEGDVDVQLPVVSQDTDGVASLSTDAAVSGGSSADDIEASSGENKGKATASVKIPAGTTLKDAEDNLITGSTLKLKVTAADTSTSAGSSITPQGLNAAGSTSVLKPVGVASVEMTNDAGVKVKKFSQPITVSMAIPASKGVQPGDELSLSSQNEDTGVWSAETQKVTVGSLVASGNYYNASFETNHLTFYAATEVKEACTAPIRILATGDAIPASGLIVSYSSDDLNGSDRITADDLAVIADNVSTDDTAIVTVKDADGNVWFESASEVAVCGDINVALANPVTYVSESFAINGTCSNGAESFVASGAAVFYNRDGKAPKRAMGDGAGNYALNDLVSGETYSLTATFSGELASIEKLTASVTADDTDESASVSFECSTTTGSTGGN